jgi:hypothetical protein
MIWIARNIRRSALLLPLLLCGETTGGAAPAERLPLCVSGIAAMPESWRPPAAIVAGLSDTLWSDAEAKDAAFAVQRGLDELKEFFAGHPDRVRALGADAVESVIDAGYGASSPSAFRDAARELARQNLLVLVAPVLLRASPTPSCRDYSSLLQLAIHAQALLDTGDARTAAMVSLANAAFRACGSFEDALGTDYRRTLADDRAAVDDVWDLVMWSIMLTDAQTVPGIALPQEARDLPAAVWRYINRYRLPNATAFPGGVGDHTFYDTAYLATHMAYIPTGYGRYALKPADAPNLYRFLRENFYAVMEFGELDLTAEFVDLFREYGCTEQNDRQLRDGTRYMLKLFHSAHERWLSYREPNERADTGSYNIVHKAWTGMAAVRARVPENPAPGTYGGIVRAWLGDQ